MESNTTGQAGTVGLMTVGTGVIYQNPKPHVKSVHAYFPSVVALPNGEMLASYVLGEAFEATNASVYLSRSVDGGQTWTNQGPICSDTTGRIVSDAARLVVTPDGTLVANLVRADRTDHPDEGLTNPDNLGFVPTELLVSRSTDSGHSWSKPELIEPPLVGPEWELCSPITILRDERWLWPTSTWRNWQGELPNGNQMVALVSEDQGLSWPSYMKVMDSLAGNLIFWESKVVELTDGRLLAVAWCYDEQAKADRPNQYAISHDGGANWSPPESTGLLGQTMTPFVVDDQRILSVYRRMDKPGLWANLSHLREDRWVNDVQEPLWGYGSMEVNPTRGSSMVDNFRSLRFGAPCITRLSDGTLFVAFWCYEQYISIIRWFSLRIERNHSPQAKCT